MDDEGSQKIVLETRRHQAMLAYGLLDTPPESAFDDLASLSAQLINTPIALITLIDGDRLWVKSAYGTQGGTSSRANTLCDAALDALGITTVGDLALDPRFCNNPQYQTTPTIRFYAGAPLVTPEGMHLGTLSVMDYVPRTLRAEQTRALSALAKQVMAQMELRKERDGSRQSYRQLFVNSMDGVLLGRAEDGALFAINPAACTMLGRSEQELMEGGRRAFIDPNDPRVPKLFARRAKDGFARGEMNFVRADGTPFEIEVSSVLYKGSDGKLLASTVFRDITARKKALADLRIAASAFESQEGIFVCSANWLILKVNQAFTRQTGYSAEEAIGQKPHELLGSDRTDCVFYTGMSHGLERDGNWQGEVWDRRKNGEVYPVWLIITVLRNDDGKVTHYVATMTDITDRKSAEEEIRNLAFFDPLTGLPNRRLLMDRLGQALMSTTRIRRNGALLFLDLDNFKGLNDTLGHDMGDMLLKEVAQRLLACVREGDTVARLGGDEFIVMLLGLSEELGIAKTQAAVVGEKILDLLNQAYLLSGTVYRSTPSIGVTLFGEHNESKDELLKRADLAMYQAKAAGRNTLRFFDAGMQAEVTERMSLENALRDALARREFVLYYQPQVDGEGTITGAEVLVRWNHLQRGLIAPAGFIALAEETGVIIPMGRWILESACRQLALWATNPATAHLTVAVNVSARQLMRADFVDSVLLILRETGASPQRLKLELTESVLVSDVDNTIAKMRALKQHGVGFAMDDFGTGYSALSFLKLLPLDQLKIDQGFVRDILVDVNDAAIAKMVIALADSLGLTVIAEGVETQAQREFLSAQGCFAYQGYLFGKPMPIEAFEALLLR
jgi:diguanylate cyclase (GGDEF)-like protein/PAS domain S-box-containing protein